MNQQITDPDLQQLLSINPLPSEQLRRIIAERHVAEAQAELAKLKEAQTSENKNGRSVPKTSDIASETVLPSK